MKKELLCILLFVYAAACPSLVVADKTDDLFLAVRRNDIAAIQSLLDKGADENAVNRRGMPVLLAAGKKGHTEIIKLLLDAGADVNAEDLYDKTVLMSVVWQVRKGELDIVKLLLEAGADVNAKTKGGETALMTAAEVGHWDNVETLLKAGAEVNAVRNDGGTALMGAAQRSHLDIIKLLLEAGADINAEDNHGWTALWSAARMDRTDIVNFLLETKADVNTKTSVGKTALIAAAERGLTENVKLLLEAGADVNAKTNKDKTVLMAAVENGHTDVVKLLLKAGADVNAKDCDGGTALMWAAGQGHIEIVKLLLEADADVNAKFTDGTTALVAAEMNGHPEVVKLLSEAGAGMHAKDTLELKSQITQMLAVEDALKTPKTFHTEIHSGRVVDAATGEPIEGAVVLYKWNINEFSMFGSGSREAGVSEVFTDKEGKYIIPDQAIESQTGGIAQIEPEDVFIYKNGYIWYWVFDNQVRSFMTYMPDLQQTYRKKNNIVKLQPWIDKFSHAEHLHIFTDSGFGFKGTELYRAVEAEKALAKRELNNSRLAIDNAKKQLSQYQKAYKNGGITKEEYTAALHKLLRTQDRYFLRKIVNILKAFDDKATIEILIKSLRDRLYRHSFRDVIGHVYNLTDQKYQQTPDSISERIEITEDLEQWWQRNRDKTKPEWFADMLLNSRDEKTRESALFKLQQIADETVTPYLQEYLNSKNPNDRFYPAVLKLLAKAGSKSSIPTIKRHLYHEDIYVRREAALTLDKLGDKSGIPIMIESLKSKFKNNRSVANAVLKEITKQDFAKVKSLKRLSGDDEKEVIKKWTAWWTQNKADIKADKVTGFAKVLKGEAKARARYYDNAREAEKNNPELPTFEDPEKSPPAIFEKFKTALLNGDDEKAISYLAPHKADVYREFISQLGPHRQSYVEGMGELYFDMKLGGLLCYKMLVEDDDGMTFYPIQFTHDLNGDWIISPL